MCLLLFARVGSNCINSNFACVFDVIFDFVPIPMTCQVHSASLLGYFLKYKMIWLYTLYIYIHCVLHLWFCIQSFSLDICQLIAFFHFQLIYREERHVASAARSTVYAT